jgi:hypothetical protein
MWLFEIKHETIFGLNFITKKVVCSNHHSFKNTIKIYVGILLHINQVHVVLLTRFSTKTGLL